MLFDKYPYLVYVMWWSHKRYKLGDVYLLPRSDVYSNPYLPSTTANYTRLGYVIETYHPWYITKWSNKYRHVKFALLNEGDFYVTTTFYQNNEYDPDLPIKYDITDLERIAYAIPSVEDIKADSYGNGWLDYMMKHISPTISLILFVLAVLITQLAVVATIIYLTI